jgi:Putative prokaryotic signal transducing protein
MATDVDLVTVATFPSIIEAEIAKGRLAVEGIRAFVLDEAAAGVMPFMAGSMGGIRLQVAPHDEAKAREILSGN